MPAACEPGPRRRGRAAAPAGTGGRSPRQAAAPGPLDAQIAAVRRFSRFYTQRLGLLDRELLASGRTLTEARLLWELMQRPRLTATVLRAELGLDAGYLSRVLRRLREAGLLRTLADAADARVARLALTAAGQRAARSLDDASRRQVAQWLGALPADARPQLVAAMDQVRGLLAPAAPSATPGTAGTAGDAAGPPLTLDEPGPGDYGWVIQRHGALYAQAFGWTIAFEGLVARIVGDFAEHHQPGRERAWIARRDGVNLGCVFLVQAPPAEQGLDVAQLRLLLVEPAARGLGLGERLVATCEEAARAAGYRRMVLWTQSMLHPAVALYRRRGWQLEREEPHHSFGQDLVGQFWAKAL